MGKVADLEQAVRELPERELRRFREWFFDFDAEMWDRQFELDAAAGRLDRLAEEALEDRRAGHTRQL